MCDLCMQYLCRPEEGIRTHGTKDGVSHHGGAGNQTQVTLQEQPVLLTSRPPLHTPVFHSHQVLVPNKKFAFM